MDVMEFDVFLKHWVRIPSRAFLISSGSLILYRVSAIFLFYVGGRVG